MFYQSCVPRWWQRFQQRTHWSHHPNDFHRRAADWDPTICRIKRCWNLQMQCIKRLSKMRCALLSRWEWPPTVCWRVRYGSMIYRPRPMQLGYILPPSNGHQRVTYENWRLWPCQERKLTSMPKATKRSTFSRYYTSQFRWWSMPRHNFTKREPNRIIYQIRDYNFNPESPMNPNSNLEIQVTLLPSQNGNWQQIWSRSRWRSNKFWIREIAVSTQSSPTNKLIAHLAAVYKVVDQVV